MANFFPIIQSILLLISFCFLQFSSKSSKYVTITKTCQRSKSALRSCDLKVTAKVYIGLPRDMSYYGWRLHTLGTTLCITIKHYQAPDTRPRPPSLYEVNLAKSWPWNVCPPSSPHLNPLDYAIGGVFGAKVQATSHPSLVDLKAKISQEWDAMSVNFLRKSC